MIPISIGYVLLHVKSKTDRIPFVRLNVNLQQRDFSTESNEIMKSESLSVFMFY